MAPSGGALAWFMVWQSDRDEKENQNENSIKHCKPLGYFAGEGNGCCVWRDLSRNESHRAGMTRGQKKEGGGGQRTSSGGFGEGDNWRKPVRSTKYNLQRGKEMHSPSPVS